MESNDKSNMSLGRELKDNGKFKEAIELFSKCIILGEGGYYAYLERGYARNFLGQHSKALKDFNYVIDNNPDQSDKNLVGVALYNRADIYKGWKMYDEALADLNVAICLLPDNIFNYSLRAYVYFTLEKYELALNDINTAINIRSDFPIFYMIRASIISQQAESELKYLKDILIGKSLIHIEAEERLDIKNNGSYDIGYYPIETIEQYN